MEFFQFTNGEYENLVLKDVQLKEREQKIKDEFRQWLALKDLSIPECFAEDNDDIRFYFASGRDYQYAYDAMLENEKWILETQVPLLNRYAEFEHYLKMGFVYGYQRDKMSRPIFVFNMKKLIDSKIDVDTFLDIVDFLASYTYFHGLVPGKIETWNLIVDFKDVGLSQIPMN